jgi:hypothetical protein
MDALTSFVYLTDNLPTWITQINTLSSHVISKREEFVAEYKRVLEHARPKRKKTPSVSSILTNTKAPTTKSSKDEAKVPEVLSLPRPTEISPLIPDNKYLFANARRGKRRQGASFRSGASGPQSFRNQHQVIIYYDSFLQDSFGKLVKDIGMARNNLRKGQQSRAIEKGLQLPGFGSGSYSRRFRMSTLPSSPKSRPSPEIVLDPKPLLPESPPSDDAAFTEAAKDLESAQALCETAAHQFLRDGDCTLEIDRIRRNFENVLRIALAEVETLKQEQAKAQEKENDSRAEKQQEVEMVASAKNSPDLTAAVSKKLGPNVVSDSADDDDGEDMVIDISKFRAARMTGLRA